MHISIMVAASFFILLSPFFYHMFIIIPCAVECVNNKMHKISIIFKNYQ